MVDRIEITLDKPRQLKFTFASLRLLQARLGGASLLQIISRIESVDVEAIVQAVWIGFGGDDRKLTFDRAQELLDAHMTNGNNMADLMRPLVLAIMQASGLVKAKDNAPPEEGEAGKN